MTRQLSSWTLFVAICLIVPICLALPICVTGQIGEKDAAAESGAKAASGDDEEKAAQTEQKPAAVQTTADAEPMVFLDTLNIDTNSEEFRQLSPEHKIWSNFKDKLLVISGEVCLRRGPLEMFACPTGTKEHESVVKLDTDAFSVHVGLLAVGARPGHPARFHPEYAPAAGTEIEVSVQWTDKEGKERRVAAQEWVRNSRSKRAMKEQWVFAGSDFWTDEETGKRYYQAEAGDLICVSNFPTATLDLTVESSAANSGLLFEAFEERLPPRGTEINVILKPKPEAPEQKSSDDQASEKPTSQDATGNGQPKK